MTPGPDSCSADVAAYALGALDGAEAAAFEQHLRTCAVCPVDLNAFRQVVDDLAISAPPFRAPRELRRRVLGAVEADTRLSASSRERPRRHRRLSFNGPATILAAGVSFAAAAVIVAVIALPGRPGNRTIAADVTGNGSASLSITADHAEIDLRHVAAPARGDIYEIWLQRGDSTPTPAKAPLFSVNRAGDASVDVPGSMSGVSRVLVTSEPAGGSRRPTHMPVISATL
jgi:anti-sigma-K factor RskA